MNTKELIKLTGDNKHKPVIELAEAILLIMQQHIGVKDAVSKQELYKILFADAWDDRSLKAWMRWEFVKKAMHKCRSRTKCFVVSKRTESGTYIFYVPKDSEDIMPYKNLLDRNIKSMEFMKKRADKSVKELWYNKKVWSLE